MTSQVLGLLFFFIGALVTAPIFSPQARDMAYGSIASSACGVGQYHLCFRAAQAMSSASSERAGRILGRVCSATGKAEDCRAAAKVLKIANQFKAASLALAVGCDRGAFELCSESGSLALEEAFKTGDPAANAGLRESARHTTQLGCEHGDKGACLTAATLDLLRGDSKSEGVHLYHACFRLKASEACARYAQGFFFQGRKAEAQRTLLFLCDGRNGAGCEDGYSEAFSNAAPYQVWLGDFSSLNRQWDTVINAAYRNIVRPNNRGLASLSPASPEQVIEIEQGLASSEILMRQALGTLRSLTGLDAKRASAQEALRGYIDSVLNLTSESRRLLQIPGPSQAELTGYKKMVDSTALAYRRAAASVQAANQPITH